MILIFNRKVIPDPTEKNQGRVETVIVGMLDGQKFDIGTIKFPNKQFWTKFWGAISRGAISIPELEVKMENVEPSDADLGLTPSPNLAQVGGK